MLKVQIAEKDGEAIYSGQELLFACHVVVAIGPGPNDTIFCLVVSDYELIMRGWEFAKTMAIPINKLTILKDQPHVESTN